MSEDFRPLWTLVDGLSVYAVVSNRAPAGARDIVLVHGLGLSGTYLMPTARELAAEYRVWVPDLPGFGRSGKPDRIWDVSELADGLAGWMVAAGLSRAVLLGNSFGCQIIVECGARHPERVEAVILQGPTTTPEERSWRWQYVRWHQNPNPGMAPIAKEDYRAAGYYRVLKTFQYSIRHRPEDQLEKIQVPALVVRGAGDPVCRQEWAEEVAQRLPNGRLVVVPAVHHTMVFQNPVELVNVCRPFLNGEPLPELTGTQVHPDPHHPSGAPVAGFDSASAMCRATAAALRGRGFPVVGLWPRWSEPLARVVGPVLNALPGALKKQVYIWSGWSEAVRAQRISSVRAEQLGRWAVAQYPRRRFPAAMIGSSNGALTHLCTAMGIPWLPQTFLIPVKRSGIDPNDPGKELAWGRGPGARLLGANPDLALYHMHDPNQDQLMIRRMSYFRVKLGRLPDAYRSFLAENLEPGATLFVADCRLSWPSVKVGRRHVFQRGALGGAKPEEYLRESPRVAEFLSRQGANRRSWTGPEPDGETPEAEWGYDPRLDADLEQFAEEHGFRLRRIVFEHPEDPSPLVADLYRDWYRRREMPADTLLMSNFILMEPYWTLRTGSIPFWTVFSVEPSAARLEDYLDASEPFNDIHLMLFSHGVESIGIAPVSRWKSIAGRARRRGGLVGVDERVHPRDFAAFARYQAALRRAVPTRYPLPHPLTLEELDGFLERRGATHPVQWQG